MKRSLSLLCLALLTLPLLAADPTRVLEEGKTPDDARLGKLKTLNDYFPMTVPSTKEAWEARRKELREQVLVATGLWPMPERTPLNPVIHGKIVRDDYTIEKVFFASLPGHYVCGNLYRPKTVGDRKPTDPKLPAILCPHGHWANGRLYDAGEKEGQNQINSKAETNMNGARYPLQARCAQLARMGCVVFFYDMVGYADTFEKRGDLKIGIPHRDGFTDADAELRCQSFMGLQTWNSIRALDFLTSLPEVDPKRVGVTGASGGGTQTFILGAVDDRPAAAFPAVMVSTAMQGGCVCENCSFLRQDAGNIDIAALFAPKPLGMSGANDWTIDIERKGLPELQQVYKLYGAEDNVMARCFPQFGHNYNQVSREVMYNFFNKHLKLGAKGEVKEKDFEPVAPRDLSVFDDQHPRPKDTASAEAVRKVMTEASSKQIEALVPKDGKGFDEFRRVIGTALRVMVNDKLPKADDVEVKVVSKDAQAGTAWQRMLLSRKDKKEAIPAVAVRGKYFNGTVVVWVHPDGKGSLLAGNELTPEAKKLLDAGCAVVAPDVYLTGEFAGAKKPAVDPGFAGYTFGYNRPILAQRVHDILTTIAFARGYEKAKHVHLVGWSNAGPWAALARGLCGDAVAKTAIDFDGFRFENVRATTDEMMLPGALKYGGLPALTALAAPGELFLHNHQGTGSGHWVKPAYEVSGATTKLKQAAAKAKDADVIAWLLG